MNLKELVLANRSIRRFDQNASIAREQALALVDLARVCPSGGNLQPLKYAISTDETLNARIFPTLTWAAMLPDWDGPAEGERPVAYIVLLLDTKVASSPGCDHGIAAQTICLAAAEAGLGACMVGSIARDRLAAVLGLSDTLKIVLAIALGKPAEKVVLDEVGPDGGTRYYRDADEVHHVPKRALSDVVVGM